jgi:hypothetical protein
LERVKLKKVILFISLLPYVYLILSSLYYAVFGYTYNFAGAETIYGSRAFLDKIINRFWFDNFIMFNFIGLFCTCCIAYQIYYLINIQRKKTPVLSKRRLNIKKILFITSILTWIMYFLSGIYALFFGYKSEMFFSTNIYHGFEAFRMAMIWNLVAFTFIPILPITLIYILAYLISKKRHKK